MHNNNNIIQKTAINIQWSLPKKSSPEIELAILEAIVISTGFVVLHLLNRRFDALKRPVSGGRGRYRRFAC